VSALVVSNHGGRQLDGAPSSISALPKVVDAVGGKIEILFDGGIRSGQDVLRALALGARACMIGRAAAYGVGAGGEPGVTVKDRCPRCLRPACPGACSLGRVDKRLVASPDYLERAGTSQTVAELANHHGILTRTDLDHWSIDNQSIRVLWHISTGNMLVTRDAVCAGLGIALVLGFWPTPRSRREVL
jgi:FMN-dependent dehydrogenase